MLTTLCYAKSLQSCPTLCDPIDGSPPGSAVPGILQARMLEWVAISFSNEWKRKVKVKSLSHVRLLATPWTVAYQAPPSMGFSRQAYWSGVPLPSPWMLYRFWQIYNNIYPYSVIQNSFTALKLPRAFAYSPFLFPESLGTTPLFTVSVAVASMECHIAGITQNVTFSY